MTTKNSSQTSDIPFPRIFENAFNDGSIVKSDNQDIIFQKINLGDLKIESGKIVVCDPIVMHNAIAFKKEFPIGNFPVELAIAKMQKDRRVAFSRIVFSKNNVKNWEYALLPEQEYISLKDSTSYGFGVDSGTGLFIDENGKKIFSTKIDFEWENVFVKKMEENNNIGFIHSFEGHNLAAFATGYGDGFYSTFIGFDSTGRICRLLIDFSIIDWWNTK